MLQTRCCADSSLDVLLPGGQPKSSTRAANRRRQSPAFQAVQQAPMLQTQ